MIWYEIWGFKMNSYWTLLLNNFNKGNCWSRLLSEKGTGITWKFKNMTDCKGVSTIKIKNYNKAVTWICCQFLNSLLCWCEHKLMSVKTVVSSRWCNDSNCWYVLYDSETNFQFCASWCWYTSWFQTIKAIASQSKYWFALSLWALQ